MLRPRTHFHGDQNVVCILLNVIHILSNRVPNFYFYSEMEHRMVNNNNAQCNSKDSPESAKNAIQMPILLMYT